MPSNVVSLTIIPFSKDNFLHVIDERIMQEMEGIVDGYNSVSNTEINFEDILALNVSFDADSFLAMDNARNNGSCTSFVATGDNTLHFLHYSLINHVEEVIL